MSITNPNTIERQMCETATLGTEIAMLAGGVLAAFAFPVAMIAMALNAVDDATIVTMVAEIAPVMKPASLLVALITCAICACRIGAVSSLRGIVTVATLVAAAAQFHALRVDTTPDASSFETAALALQLCLALLTTFGGYFFYARLCRRAFLT